MNKSSNKLPPKRPTVELELQSSPERDEDHRKLSQISLEQQATQEIEAERNRLQSKDSQKKRLARILHEQ